MLFSRGDAEDFEIKGFDVAARSVAALFDTRLYFVGAQYGKHEEIAKRIVIWAFLKTVHQRAAIKGIWNRDKKSLLDEVKAVRCSYGERYCWSEQCKCLIEEMLKLELSLDCTT